MDKEQEQVIGNYALVTDRICLLSNNLPSNELSEQDNGINASLFLNNLSLRRKNARLNKFNNKLHQQINNTRNHVLININDSSK